MQRKTYMDVTVIKRIANVQEACLASGRIGDFRLKTAVLLRLLLPGGRIAVVRGSTHRVQRLLEAMSVFRPTHRIDLSGNPHRRKDGVAVVVRVRAPTFASRGVLACGGSIPGTHTGLGPIERPLR